MALATWVVEQRALLVSDEIFGLVNLTNPTAETVHSPVTLEQVVPGVGARTVVLGGLSKEFAAGGLRLGWLATRDRGWSTALRDSGLVPPTLATARAAAWLYAAYARSPEGRLLYPARHRALREFLVRMRQRAGGEASARSPGRCRARGTPTPRRQGASSSRPRMSTWLGREVDGRAPHRGEPAARRLRAHARGAQRRRVVLETRSGCALVFSIPRDKLEQARERLLAFAARLGPGPG